MKKSELERLVNERAGIKALQDQQSRRVAEIDAVLLDELEDVKTLTVKIGDSNITVTRVQTETTWLDEDSLRDRIGNLKFKRLLTEVTQTMFDQDKLEAAIESGRVKVEDVKASTDTKLGKPYVKQTVRSAVNDK